MSPSMRVNGATFILLGAVLLGGCSEQKKRVAPLPPPVDICGVKMRAKPITFRTEDGVRLAGAALGRGDRGVVFANPWGAVFKQGRARPISLRRSVPGGGLYCAWLVAPRLADDLVRSGFQLLLFDYRGTGMSGSRRGAAIERFDLDVAAAAAELRRRGAEGVVLLGASVGGLIVIAAAPELNPEPRAIITLSAKGAAGTNTGRGYGNLNAKAAVEGLDVPLLLVAAESDREDAAVARALFAAATTNRKALEIVPGSAHATALFSEGPAAAEVRARILDFVKEYGRG